MTWDDVVAFCLTLPETELGSSWGSPSLKVAKKMFVRLRTENDAPGAVALRCTPDDKVALVDGPDPAWFTTPHYDGYDYVLVRPEQADPIELREQLTEAWRIAAPARLRKVEES